AHLLERASQEDVLELLRVGEPSPSSGIDLVVEELRRRTGKSIKDVPRPLRPACGKTRGVADDRRNPIPRGSRRCRGGVTDKRNPVVVIRIGSRAVETGKVILVAPAVDQLRLRKGPGRR